MVKRPAILEWSEGKQQWPSPELGRDDRSRSVDASRGITSQDIIAALDRAPLTLRHAAFIAALLAATIFDYAKPFTISFVIPGMREMWNLSQVSASYLAVAGLSGTVVGSVFWAFIADRIGRRTTLLWTIGIFSLATVCGFAVHYWHSLLSCFLMGFGVGGELPIAFALAAECLPTKVRARLVLFLAIIGATGGYALAALTAAAANALYPDAVAWRAMWLVQLLPAALLLILRSRILPESARYLLAHNRIEEARAAAESLIGPISITKPITQPKEANFALPSQGLYGRTLALGFYSFAWGLANFGFITWLPTLLRNMGYTGATSSMFLALSALIALPALGITAYLYTKWSTKWTLTAFAVGSALSLLVLGAGLTVGWSPSFLVVASSLALFFITSIGGAFSLYAAEAFPTAIRAQRSGIIAGVGKLGGVAGPYLGGLWLAGGGSALGLQAPFAAALITAAAVLALAGVETRGRSLEQIHGQ